MAKISLWDTMIGSPDIAATAKFYKAFLKLKVVEKGDGSYVVLHDPETRQRVCVVSMPQLKNAALGVAAPNLDRALATLEKLGGKVGRRWSFPGMKGANCKDADGHEMIVWQTLPAKK